MTIIEDKRSAGMAPLLEAYDFFAIDLWGVMHHGGAILPEAKAVIQAMADQGKGFSFLSNAPRRVSVVQQQLQDKGLPFAQAQHVHTSGEETYAFLHSNPQGWRCGLVFEPQAAYPDMHDGLPLAWTQDVREADFVLLLGVPYDTADLRDYEPLMQAMADRGLPLVCANPDQWVRIGDRLSMCAGYLARHYATAFDGEVLYFGKPHAHVYQRLAHSYGLGDQHKVLTIGDLVETDVAGGQAAGFGTCLIEGGVLAKQRNIASGASLENADLQAEFARLGVSPDHIVPLMRLHS